MPPSTTNPTMRPTDLSIHGLGDREAAVSHQPVGVDVTAAEAAERDVGRDGVPHAEDGLAQTVAGGLVVEAARLDEGFGDIRRHRLGPDVDVVTSRVAVTGEDVAECGRPMPHDD